MNFIEAIQALSEGAPAVRCRSWRPNVRMFLDDQCLLIADWALVSTYFPHPTDVLADDWEPCERGCERIPGGEARTLGDVLPPLMRHKSFRRKAWDDGTYIALDNHGEVSQFFDGHYIPYIITREDICARDWEVSP